MGLTHIYCGNGKGKTSSAMGLALRAAGAGMRVHIVQLLKGSETSELNTLALIPNITVRRCDKDYGFTFSMSSSEKLELTNCHDRLLSEAEKLMNNGEIDVLIIDEFNAAYKYELIDIELADRIVCKKNPETELVLTGRDPHEKFLQAADYISEIKAVKHPYSCGIGARKGIEY